MQDLPTKVLFPRKQISLYLQGESVYDRESAMTGSIRVTDGASNRYHLKMPSLQLPYQRRIRSRLCCSLSIKGSCSGVSGQQSPMWISLEIIQGSPEQIARLGLAAIAPSRSKIRRVEAIRKVYRFIVIFVLLGQSVRVTHLRFRGV